MSTRSHTGLSSSLDGEPDFEANFKVTDLERPSELFLTDETTARGHEFRFKFLSFTRTTSPMTIDVFSEVHFLRGRSV